VEATRLTIDPHPQYLTSRVDYFGNRAHVFMVQHPHKSLMMKAVSRVSTSAPTVPDPEGTPAWESVVTGLRAYETPEALTAYQYVFESPLVHIPPGIRDFAIESFPSGRPVLHAALDLNRRIFKEFAYDKTSTTIDTPIEQVLAQRKGVCQDFSHLAIACFRSLGLAARYVSGYLETLPPPGKPKLVGADASHAWVSVFVPGTGWVDLDPTNNLIPGERHITLAWGRDYGDVTPVKGVVMGGGMHTLAVNVDVSSER
jgi:transglutaminase-like putative cysteine protease